MLVGTTMAGNTHALLGPWLAAMAAPARFIESEMTSNDLRYRSPAFAAGFMVLVALWAWFALHLTGAA